MAGNFLGFDYAPNHDTPMGVVAKIRGNIERAKEESARVAVEGAHVAADIMRTEAPGKGSIAARVETDNEAVWHPGGAGGGGFWEASAGVINLGPDEDYPLFVFRGTGEKVGHDRIFPNPGNVFPLTGLVSAVTGSIMFKQWQTGQEPQTGWVEHAQEAADVLVRSRLHDIPAQGR